MAKAPTKAKADPKPTAMERSWCVNQAGTVSYGWAFTGDKRITEEEAMALLKGEETPSEQPSEEIAPEAAVEAPQEPTEAPGEPSEPVQVAEPQEPETPSEQPVEAPEGDSVSDSPQEERTPVED